MLKSIIYVTVVLLGYTTLGNENIIANGGFEQPDLKAVNIRSFARDMKTRKKVNYQKKDIQFKRQSQTVHSGLHALQFSCLIDNGINEANYHRVPFVKGHRYQFSAWYLISAASPKTKVTGRVIFFDANKKVIKYLFPTASNAMDKWQEFKFDFIPPRGTAEVAITLWFSGKHTITLDDVSCRDITAKKGRADKASSGLILDNSECAIWQQAAYDKVSPQGFPVNSPMMPVIKLTVAGNEKEPFQLVVTAKKKLPDVALQFSDLKNREGHTIAASSISYFVVDFVNLKEPDAQSLKGLHADPLLPGKSRTATPERNLPFYVMVHVPDQQQKGTYKGMVTLTSKERVLTEIPLQVKVRNFSIPTAPYLKTYFYGLVTPAFREFDKRSVNAIHKDQMTWYKELRITGNQALRPPMPKWRIDNDQLTITDWTAFDQCIIERSSQYGFREFPVPGMSMLGDNSGWWNDKPPKAFGYSLLSERGLRYYCQYAKQFMAHVKKTFSGLSFYAYIYDEPPRKIYSALTDIIHRINRDVPDLNILLTKSVSPKLGNIGLWCVPFAPGLLKPDMQQAVKKTGSDIWYYNWPVRISDCDYIRGRLFPWQIYANDGDGGLLWQTLQTEKGINPWDQLEKTYGCGKATLMYPAKSESGRLVPSLRFYQIREGIDDYDYMKILENKINMKFPGQGKRRVKEIISSILPELPFEYKNDSTLLYSLRERLADEIEALETEPPALVLSMPPENSESELTNVELMVFASPGATVSVNNAPPLTVTAEGRLDIPVILTKLGRNQVEIKITDKNHSKVFKRIYNRKADPRLAELQKLAKQAKDSGNPSMELESFLKQLKGRQRYTKRDRDRVTALINQAKRQHVKQALRLKVPHNKLASAFHKQAEWAFENQLFERADYYLTCQEQAEKATCLNGGPLTLEPVMIGNHFALKMKNRTIEAVILETGGRLASFKVDGIECLQMTNLKNAYSPIFRARRNVNNQLIPTLPAYGGYEDAGGSHAWPISSVDWNLQVREANSNAIVISTETVLPGNIFCWRKTYTMTADKPELRIDYAISNRMPKSFISDDPESYQITWRGRWLPGIGNSSESLPQENDILVVPTTPAIPEKQFLSTKPTFFEWRSFPLDKPFMGAFDPILKKGFAAILPGSTLTHGYIWFSSKGSHDGTGKVYTLETPRSFYGQKHDAKQRNRPFSVKPGETVTFKITLLGLSDVGDIVNFQRQIQQLIRKGI